MNIAPRYSNMTAGTTAPGPEANTTAAPAFGNAQPKFGTADAYQFLHPTFNQTAAIAAFGTAGTAGLMWIQQLLRGAKVDKALKGIEGILAHIQKVAPAVAEEAEVAAAKLAKSA
jgi:hypothetical protein